MLIEEISFYIAMAGTVAFASSAVLSIAERKVDLFAAVVLGVRSELHVGVDLGEHRHLFSIQVL